MTTLATLEATVAEKLAAFEEAAARLAPYRTVEGERDYVNDHYRACLAVAREAGVLLNGPATYAAARESWAELRDMAKEIYKEALQELTNARVALWSYEA